MFRSRAQRHTRSHRSSRGLQLRGCHTLERCVRSFVSPRKILAQRQAKSKAQSATGKAKGQERIALSSFRLALCASHIPPCCSFVDRGFPLAQPLKLILAKYAKSKARLSTVYPPTFQWHNSWLT